MAILHMVMKSSSKAPQARPHSDYIMRKGKYARRGEIEHAEYGNMPEFAEGDPRLFWKAADANERVNGRAYTEIQVALPREIDQASRIELAREIAAAAVGDRHAYALAVHNPAALDGGEQPHMHLMFSERVIDERTRQLGPREYFRQSGAKKDRAWNDRGRPLALRGKVCELLNGALERAGLKQRLDPRSWEAQGFHTLAQAVEPKMRRGKHQAEVLALREARKEYLAEAWAHQRATRAGKVSEAELAELDKQLEKLQAEERAKATAMTSQLDAKLAIARDRHAKLAELAGEIERREVNPLDHEIQSRLLHVFFDKGAADLSKDLDIGFARGMTRRGLPDGMELRAGPNDSRQFVVPRGIAADVAQKIRTANDGMLQRATERAVKELEPKQEKAPAKSKSRGRGGNDLGR